jgi:two-component system LytT family response regulator
MILSALIVDDEQSARENLNLMLANLLPDCKIFMASNVMDAKELTLNNAIQVIFLDINMPQHDGFDLFEIIDSDKYFIVVVSAHLDYSLKAIKLKVFDFLLKPFGFTTLKETLQRIENELSSSENRNSSNRKLTFKTRTEIYYVEPSDIVYCESDNNYTTIHLASNKKILLAKSIKAIEEELSFPFFFRVHRSFIINTNFISSFNTADDTVFLLNESVKVPVSDRRKKDFLTFISQ